MTRDRHQTSLLTANRPTAPPIRHASRVAVIHDAEHYRLMATEAIAAGACVCPINGERTTAPTRWTIQVSARVHIEADPAATLDEHIERFPWRFLNHSCEPNTRIAGLNVIAIRPILAGEELTFNYNSTEFAMASPFACHCGSLVCGGMIRGFTHLTPAEQQRLLPYLSPHMRRLFKRSRAEVATGIQDVGTLTK